MSDDKELEKKRFLEQFRDAIHFMKRGLAAHADFLMYIRDHPRHYLAWKYLSISYALRREYDYSMKCFETMKKIDSSIDFSWNLMGFQQIEMKDYKNAKKNLEFAYKINPQNSVTLFGLVAVNYNLKEYKSALNFLNQIKQLPVENNQWEAWKLVIEGNILRKMKKHDQAIKIFKEAYDIVDDKSLPAFNMLVIALLTNNYEIITETLSSAEEYYKRYQQGSPRLFNDKFVLNFQAIEQQKFKITKVLRRELEEFNGFPTGFGMWLILFSIIDDFIWLDNH